MSFDWRTYLELASELVEKNSEASYRSGISRSYYAIYNVLRIRASYSNRAPEANHVKFIQELKNPSEELYLKFPFDDESDLVMIGNELDYLRKARNKADYNGLDEVRRVDCKDAIEKVECIFEMLDEADNDDI